MSEPKRKASEAYLAKLKDPRWQKKRLEIMSRDGFKCQFCDDTKKTLNVHHLAYVSGRDPWDYDNHYLLTLCETCHEFERERATIEGKLLLRLKMAGISSEQLDSVACPTGFGDEHYSTIFRFFDLILNLDLLKRESILASIDAVRAKVVAHFDSKEKGAIG